MNHHEHNRRKVWFDVLLTDPIQRIARSCCRCLHESGGIGISFKLLNTANSPAVLPSASLRFSQLLLRVPRSTPRSDRIATRASCSGTEGLNVCSRDSLPFALELPNWWACLSTIHLPSAILHGTRIALLCSNLLTSRALNTLYAVTTKHSRLLLLTPSHTPHLYLGFVLFNGSEDIGLASTFSPNGTNSCVGFLPRNLSNGVRPSRPFWHLCEALSTWHLMILMTPPNNITAFSAIPFEGLSPLTASSDVTSVWQF